MHFEVHRLSTKLFVDHEIEKLSHKARCGYFMSHKTGGANERTK